MPKTVNSCQCQVALEVRIQPGTTIKTAAKLLSRLAEKLDEHLFAKYNEDEILVHPGETAKRIEAHIGLTIKLREEREEEIRRRK